MVPYNKLTLISQYIDTTEVCFLLTLHVQSEVRCGGGQAGSAPVVTLLFRLQEAPLSGASSVSMVEQSL